MMNYPERTDSEEDLFYEELPIDFHKIIEEDFELASIETYNLSKELDETKKQLAELKQKYEEKDRNIKTILHSLKDNIETKRTLFNCIIEIKSMAEKICSIVNEVLPKDAPPPLDSYLQLQRESHDWSEPKRPFSAIIQNKNKQNNQNEEKHSYYSPMKGFDILSQWEKMCNEKNQNNDHHISRGTITETSHPECVYPSNVSRLPLYNNDNFTKQPLTELQKSHMIEHDPPRRPVRETNRSYHYDNDEVYSDFYTNDFDRLYSEYNV